MKTYRHLSDCWEVVAAAPSLALDIETSGLHPARDRVCVISLSTEDGDVLVWHDPHAYELPGQLAELLRMPKEWLTHNGTNFDLPFLRHHLGVRPPSAHYDTLVAEGVLATSGRKDVPKNLGAVMKRRLGKDTKLSIDHSTWQLDTLTDEQVEYAAADVRSLHAIRRVQTKVAAERNLTEAMAKEQLLTLPMSEMRGNGLALSVDRLDGLRQEFVTAAEDANDRVLQQMGLINVNSATQVKAMAKLVLGIDLPDTTALTLNYVGREYPILRDILTVRRSTKRSGFYDPEWVKEHVVDGQVYANWWQVGTATTRLSSTQPNLQQIPRNMRAMVGNEDGCKVVQADFGQIELRVMAFFAQDLELIEALKAEDFHR